MCGRARGPAAELRSTGLRRRESTRGNNGKRKHTSPISKQSSRRTAFIYSRTDLKGKIARSQPSLRRHQRLHRRRAPRQTAQHRPPSGHAPKKRSPISGTLSRPGAPGRASSKTAAATADSTGSSPMSRRCAKNGHIVGYQSLRQKPYARTDLQRPAAHRRVKAGSARPPRRGGAGRAHPRSMGAVLCFTPVRSSHGPPTPLCWQPAAASPFSFGNPSSRSPHRSPVDS